MNVLISQCLDFWKTGTFKNCDYFLLITVRLLSLSSSRWLGRKLGERYNVVRRRTGCHASNPVATCLLTSGTTRAQLSSFSTSLSFSTSSSSFSKSSSCGRTTMPCQRPRLQAASWQVTQLGHNWHYNCHNCQAAQLGHNCHRQFQ